MKTVTFKTKSAFDAFVASDTFKGKALHVVVCHDDWCNPYACTCRPEYVVEDLTVENFEAGRKAQAAWLKARSS
jgi:hypothetical protein